MSESVEGLTESHITYKLKATVARGKFAHDLHSYKPVRIVRTLDPSALELAHAMTVENVWPNKVEYQIVIPQKAVIFGTAIAVEMRFTPLLKGLVIGKVKAQLFELHELTTPGTVAYSEKMFKLQRDIKQWELEISEDNYQDMINEDGQDGYTLKTKMELPKSLSLCVQDVDVHGIKIRHKIKFHIALHNPDGHVSEVCVSRAGWHNVALTVTASCDSSGDYFHLAEHATDGERAAGRPNPHEYTISGSGPTCATTLRTASAGSALCGYEHLRDHHPGATIWNEHALPRLVARWLAGKSHFT